VNRATCDERRATFMGLVMLKIPHSFSICLLNYRALLSSYNNMAKRKNILTTGQVAQICNVAPRTVTKWFDSGQLKGYRIPGSRDRRIPAPELIRFMKIHNIPTDMLETGKIRLLIVDTDWEMASTLQKAIKSATDYQVETAHDSFEAGLVAQRLNPHVILINLLAETIDAVQICKNIRSSVDLQGTKIIAMADKITDAEAKALLQKGFDSSISNISDITQVIKIIEEATAIIY